MGDKVLEETVLEEAVLEEAVLEEVVLEEVDLEEAVGKADSRMYQKRGRKSSFFKRSVHGEVLNISNNVLINRHHM